MSSMSTRIPRELLQAYLATLYEAQTGEPAPLVLRIGEHSPRLLAAHRKAKVDASVFITAFNPEGRPLSAEENEVRHQQLMNALRDRVPVLFEGRGYSPANDWEERSVLALGVPLGSARELGTSFGQNAIVWSGADAVPRLILLR